MTIAPPPPAAAHMLLRRAYAEGKVVVFTDLKVLARPGSPLHHPLDIFAPLLIMLVSSLTFLFAFGLLEWIFTLAAILLFQLYGAPRWMAWRVRQRAIDALLKNPHNLHVLWMMGGLAFAPKDWPEQTCVGPYGDWISFFYEYFPDRTPPEIVEDYAGEDEWTE